MGWVKSLAQIRSININIGSILLLFVLWRPIKFMILEEKLSLSNFDEYSKKLGYDPDKKRKLIYGSISKLIKNN